MCPICCRRQYKNYKIKSKMVNYKVNLVFRNTYHSKKENKDQESIQSKADITKRF